MLTVLHLQIEPYGRCRTKIFFVCYCLIILLHAPKGFLLALCTLFWDCKCVWSVYEWNVGGV